jgi:hypothetical protein
MFPMNAPRPLLGFALASALLGGCATTPATPATSAASEGATTSTPAPIGGEIPFRFQPDVQKPWGLRVARHRTLPAPPGAEGSLHFDTEEDSRLWASRAPTGEWILDEVLTRHSETKNGEPDEDPILQALQGVTVGMEITPEGKFKSAVDPARAVQQIARRTPGGEQLPAEEFAKEVERDWRLGAQVYFEQPVRVNQPVYSLLSVSLPQLPGRYVAVAETFAAPVPASGGGQKVTSSEQIFGRADPRWSAARAKLAPLMQQVGITEDQLLEEFAGTGSETVGVQTLQVFSSGYHGEGVFPLATPRGNFKLRFEVEEVAGEIAAPPIPTDPGQTAQLLPRR